jgi:preprotein translocase subunit SecY
MKFLKNLTASMKKLKWVTSILSWLKIPIPQLAAIKAALIAFITLSTQYMAWLNKKNKETSDQINQSTEQAGIKIEEERQKPLPEQNNDVLREQARKRHNNEI